MPPPPPTLVKWNATLLGGDVVDAVLKLKEQPGGDILRGGEDLEVHHLAVWLAAGVRRDGGEGHGQPGRVPRGLRPYYAFMDHFHKDLEESGELVDAQGLAAPVHTRRIQLQNGVPVVTDGPYAETEEVLAGYTLVECESFDRATEIAGWGRLGRSVDALLPA